MVETAQAPKRQLDVGMARTAVEPVPFLPNQSPQIRIVDPRSGKAKGQPANCLTVSFSAEWMNVKTPRLTEMDVDHRTMEGW